MVWVPKKAWRFIRDNKDLGLEAYFILDDNKIELPNHSNPRFCGYALKYTRKIN
jgi:hypothetical protein